MTQESEFMHFFDECNPAFDSGEEVNITVGQTLDNITSGNNNIKIPEGKIKLKIQGVQTRLGANDIVGMYPAPGSDNSPDNFLPHIALRSRTLPWERRVYPDQNPQYAWDKVWLALLLFTNNENIKDVSTEEIPDVIKLDSTENSPKTIRILKVPRDLLSNILPQGEELAKLCHMRQIPESTEEAKLDDDSSISIIIGNRLPTVTNDKDNRHYVYLVSLENRKDLYDKKGYVRQGFPRQEVPLLVLHSWSFTASDQGDFESVIKGIRYPKINGGGVLRYGNLPPPKSTFSGNPAVESLLDEKGYFKDDFKIVNDIEASNIRYHGPLMPKSVAYNKEHLKQGYAISRIPEEFSGHKTLDYTYATAFELGRMIALSDQVMVTNLQEIKRITRTIPDLKCDDNLKDDRHPAVDWLKDFIEKNKDPDREKPHPVDELDILRNMENTPRADISGVDKAGRQRYPEASASGKNIANAMLDKVKILQPATIASSIKSELSLDAKESQLETMFSDVKDTVRFR